MRSTSWLWRWFGPGSSSARRPRVARFRPSLEPLESRRVLATLLVSPTGVFDSTPTPFTSIQSAVDAASPGDTILVGPGTYQEQVLISKDGLDLESATPGAAVIKAPSNDVLAGNAAVVDIQNAANVVLDGFTIRGPGPSLLPFGSLNFGVYVDGASSATIENNTITQISDNPPSPNASGVGIEVGLSANNASLLGLASTVGSALVLNNTIDNYQLAGIVVDNAGSSATVQGNTVLGAASDVAATYGIVMSNGAAGVIQGNTVSGNVFVVGNGTQAVGIWLSNPGAGVQVLGNTVFSNDVGIAVQGAANPVISGNSVSMSTDDGIDLLAGTSGAQVTANLITDNGLDGIFVNADNNTITNNTAIFNSRDGIELMQASGNLVQGNLASQNARYGISQFLSDGESNTLVDNDASGNTIGDYFA
jgi:parallel beta-helix repeat protein